MYIDENTLNVKPSPSVYEAILIEPPGYYRSREPKRLSLNYTHYTTLGLLVKGLVLSQDIAQDKRPKKRPRHGIPQNRVKGYGVLPQIPNVI